MIVDILSTAPGAKNSEEAPALIGHVFREVEDAHSGAPEFPMNAERLYPPVASMAREVEGKPWLRRYRHTNHFTLIAENGAILIGGFVRERRSGVVAITGHKTVLDKPGGDGRRISDLEDSACDSEE